MVFGDGAYVHVPFTLDHELLRQMLAELQVGMAGARTKIGDAIGLATKMFAASDARHKVMIVLSDGNDTGSKIPPETAATIADQRGVTMHAVAIGDPATRGNEKVQLATLQDIARIGHGSFALGTDQRQLSRPPSAVSMAIRVGRSADGNIAAALDAERDLAANAS